MNNRYLLFCLFIAFFLCLNSCGGSSDSSQSYIITINNTKLGRLIISEKTDKKGSIECVTEQERDTPGSNEEKRITMRTKMVFQKGELFPVSYSAELITPGVIYDSKVKDGRIIRTMKKDDKTEESVIPLEPGMVMLDMSAFHTFEYWLRGYDADKGGHQALKTCLMPSGIVKNIYVNTAAGLTTVKEIEYQVRSGDEISIDVWVDQNNRLTHMSNNRMNMKITRSDIYDRYDAEKTDSILKEDED